MLKNVTRSRLMQVWFAAVALVFAAALAFGVSVTMGTGATLLALCLVPPAVILMLWPGVQPPTIAEVLHDAERRG
jgi:fatty acid desaturase